MKETRHSMTHHPTEPLNWLIDNIFVLLYVLEKGMHFRYMLKILDFVADYNCIHFVSTM